MTNRMGSTKWAYQEKRSFATTLFFRKFEYKNLLKMVDLMYQVPKYPYLYFSEALEFYLRVDFPVGILDGFPLKLR